RCPPAPGRTGPASPCPPIHVCTSTSPTLMISSRGCMRRIMLPPTMSKILVKNGKLVDKVALITGGASGIGREIARIYVEEGAHVVLGDRNGVLVTDAAKELGGAAVAVEMDVTRETD